jgi:hypothetical protein
MLGRWWYGLQVALATAIIVVVPVLGAGSAKAQTIDQRSVGLWPALFPGGYHRTCTGRPPLRTSVVRKARPVKKSCEGCKPQACATCQCDMGDLIEQIRSINASVTVNTTNVRSEITTVNDNIMKVDNALTTINSNVTNATNNLTTINDNIVKVDNRLTTINDNVANATNNLTTINDNVTNVRNSVTKINLGVDSLVKLNAGLPNIVAGLGVIQTNVAWLPQVRLDLQSILSTLADPTVKGRLDTIAVTLRQIETNTARPFPPVGPVTPVPPEVPPSADIPRELKSDDSAILLKEMGDCFAQGGEAHLTPTAAKCEPFRTAFKKIDEGKPQTGDAARVCRERTDKRILPPNAVAQLSRHPFKPSGTGIRIIGAIFCERLDLVGVVLHHSLVLDDAVLRDGAMIRNTVIDGDLSLEHALITNELFIGRTRIGGTIFTRAAFARELRFEDVTIGASLDMRRMIVAENLTLARAFISGDLRLERAATSFLVIRHSRVAARVELSDLNLRCAAHLNQNDIGTVFAVRTGFGEIAPGAKQYHWGGARLEKPFGRFEGNLEAAKSLRDDAACPLAEQKRPEFSIIDNNVSRSMCIREFRWPREAREKPPATTSQRIADAAGGNPLAGQSAAIVPTGNSAQSSDQSTVAAIALYGTTIGNSLILDLYGKPLPKNEPRDGKPTIRHRLEMVGVEAKSFYMDFAGDNAHDYSTFVNGLKFERALTAQISCLYARVDEGSGGPGTEGGGPNGLASDPELPSVSHVMSWLAKNTANSTQPFAAFVDAYARAGNDAKPLKIKKAWNELGADGDRWREQFWASTDRLIWTLETLTLGWRHLAGYVADFGHRPEKVVQWIIVVLLVAVIVFWGLFGAYGFKVKGTDRLLPFGIIFFFDRLIPLYKLREDHYNIETVMVRPTLPWRKATSQNGCDLARIRFFWLNPQVVPADSRQQQRILTWIEWIKIVGVILTIFFSAAIGALVVK